MHNLTILVGPPGSGKTTLAEQYTERGYHRVSQDDQGKAGHMERFTSALAYGENIILDRMNFSREQRERYIKPAREAGYGVDIIVLQVPYAICLKRCLERTNHPTVQDEQGARQALHTFFSKYEKPAQDEASDITFAGHHDISNKPQCVIVDLDGTLCNIDHRLSYVHGIRKDWGSFFRNIPYDGVNEWCRELVSSLSHNMEIVLCSGRPDDHRPETEKWLTENEIDYRVLHMRRRGDFRKDDVVKEIILDFEILPRYEVLMAVDDRKQVVDMWRRRGITCLACAEGEF